MVIGTTAVSGQPDNGERNGLPRDSSGSQGKSDEKTRHSSYPLVRFTTTTMRVHGWTDGKGGTSWYRTKEPIRGLRKRGHDVTVGPALFDGGDLCNYDALLVRALHDRWNSDGWQKLAEIGRHTLVYDLDDDVWNWHPATEQYRYWTAERLVRAEQNIIAANVVTTPSETFASYLRHLNRNVVVIPNTVPVWLTRIRPERSDRPFVIGWEGAPHHIDDLKIVWGPVFRFLLRHPKAQFWLWGPSQFEDLPPRLENRIKCFPWIKDVPAYYRALDMDICLAPLEDTPFNETKSGIRVQEHSALGIPVIASPRAAYDGYLFHNVNGLFAESEQEWEDSLEMLFKRPDLRYEFGREGRKIAERWTTEANAHLWEETMTSRKAVRA